MAGFWVAVGGATGAWLRFMLESLTSGILGREGSILFINATGSFFLALLSSYWMTQASAESDISKLLLGTGLLGGFTTYSTFNLQVFSLIQTGHWSKAFLYLITTVVICLVAGFLGFLCAKIL